MTHDIDYYVGCFVCGHLATGFLLDKTGFERPLQLLGIGIDIVHGILTGFFLTYFHDLVVAVYCLLWFFSYCILLESDSRS
jgi:hypothetical protein